MVFIVEFITVLGFLLVTCSGIEFNGEQAKSGSDEIMNKDSGTVGHWTSSAKKLQTQCTPCLCLAHLIV